MAARRDWHPMSLLPALRLLAGYGGADAGAEAGVAHLVDRYNAATGASLTVDAARDLAAWAVDTLNDAFDGMLAQRQHIEDAVRAADPSLRCEDHALRDVDLAWKPVDALDLDSPMPEHDEAPGFLDHFEPADPEWRFREMAAGPWPELRVSRSLPSRDGVLVDASVSAWVNLWAMRPGREVRAFQTITVEVDRRRLDCACLSYRPFVDRERWECNGTPLACGGPEEAEAQAAALALADRTHPAARAALFTWHVRMCSTCADPAEGRRV